MKTCPFCQLAAQSESDFLIYSDELVLAFLDIAPVAKGHAVIIPREHHNSLTTVPAACLARMMEVAPALGAALMRTVDADGFNLLVANGACAGQALPHVSLQVIPRHADDALLLPVMTVPYSSAEEKQGILEAMRSRVHVRLTVMPSAVSDEDTSGIL